MRQKAEERNDFHWGMFLQPCARKALMKIMNINAHSPKTEIKCSGALEWVIKEKNQSEGKITVYRAMEASGKVWKAVFGSWIFALLIMCFTYIKYNLSRITSSNFFLNLLFSFFK